MSLARRVGLAIAVVFAILLGLAVWRLLPVITGPALPDGATRLHLATQSPNLTPGCMTALLSPARVTTVGDELALVSVETGETLRVRWPSGFAAWRLDGRAVLADPWGSVVATDGDVLDHLGGGGGSDEVFEICPYGL